MNRGRRLRAPRRDGEVLIDPPFNDLPALVELNAQQRAARTCDLSGPSLAALSDEARVELLAAARNYTGSYRDVGSQTSPSRIVLAGHQPELFHPGVWAKNFVLSDLAKANGATAVNLVVDGDTLKTASIRVPGGTRDQLHFDVEPFDASGDEVPSEERRVLDVPTWQGFGARVVERLRPLGIDPLCRTLWPAVVERAKACDRIGLAFAQARHQFEGSLGLETLELPQSRMCETRSFRRFALNLLLELPRFVDVHNTALVEYRRRERIRSANHPVPELVRDDAWHEAPLWIWTADDPRRRHLFARRVGDDLELTDRARVTFRIPAPAGGKFESAVEALEAAARRGVRLRSRALLTTMYARLVLSDLFLHGIGGAKYDELTDLLIERFFGVMPPQYAVVTATKLLPLGGGEAKGPDPTALRQRLWSIAHHPERFLDREASSALEERRRAQEFVAEKRRWIAVEADLANSRRRCQAIRAINRDLQPFVEAARQSAEAELAAARDRQSIRAVRDSREYAFCLFPQQEICDFLLEIVGRQRYLEPQ